jgi:hypothetical protein
MAKDLTTTVYEPIQPEGLALALLVVTIVFTALSTIVVGLRFYVRVSLNLFAVEDWLMLAGWVSATSFSPPTVLPTHMLTACLVSRFSTLDTTLPLLFSHIVV